MEGKKPDRRVLKTKRAIRNALAQLLVEKELDEITVKDVRTRRTSTAKHFTTTTPASIRSLMRSKAGLSLPLTRRFERWTPAGI